MAILGVIAAIAGPEIRERLGLPPPHPVAEPKADPIVVLGNTRPAALPNVLPEAAPSEPPTIAIVGVAPPQPIIPSPVAAVSASLLPEAPPETVAPVTERLDDAGVSTATGNSDEELDELVADIEVTAPRLPTAPVPRPSRDAREPWRQRPQPRSFRGRTAGHSFGRVTVGFYVTPDDASVYVDGSYVGTSRDELWRGVPLDRGQHQIRLSKSGYRAETFSLDLTDGAPRSVRRSLAPCRVPEGC